MCLSVYLSHSHFVSLISFSSLRLRLSLSFSLSLTHSLTLTLCVPFPSPRFASVPFFFSFSRARSLPSDCNRVQVNAPQRERFIAAASTEPHVKYSFRASVSAYRAPVLRHRISTATAPLRTAQTYAGHVTVPPVARAMAVSASAP